MNFRFSRFLLLLMFSVFYCFVLEAQTIKCYTTDAIFETESTNADPLLCGFENFESQEEVERSISIIYLDVAFHFIEPYDDTLFHCDGSGETQFFAPDIIRTLVEQGNMFLRDPQINLLGNPNQLDVFDTRIRYRLPDDICSFYRHYHYGTIVDDIIPFENRINIVFANDSDGSGNFNPCDAGGEVLAGGDTPIYGIYNLLASFVYGQCPFPLIWGLGRTLNHEMGHDLGLYHSYSSLQLGQCHGVEHGLDWVLEWNGGNVWNSGSNNMMGGNPSETALVPCQWRIMINTLVNEKRPYADFCGLVTDSGNDDSDDDLPLIIESGQEEVWADHKRLLDKDVILRPRSELTISCEVQMGEGHRIIVERGARLRVEQGKITRLCDGLWGGIVVHGNAGTEQPSPYGELEIDDSGVVLIKNSVIEFADTGVRADGIGLGLPYAEQSNGGQEYKFPARHLIFQLCIELSSF